MFDYQSLFRPILSSPFFFNHIPHDNQSFRVGSHYAQRVSARGAERPSLPFYTQIPFHSVSVSSCANAIITSLAPFPRSCQVTNVTPPTQPEGLDYCEPGERSEPCLTPQPFMPSSSSGWPSGAPAPFPSFPIDSPLQKPGSTKALWQRIEDS